MKITFKKLIKIFIPYGILYFYRHIKYRKVREELEKKAEEAKRRKDYFQKGEAHKIETLKSYFLKTGEDGNKYFDINGAKLPDISDNSDMMTIFMWIFEDIFMVPFLLEDNYSQEKISILDLYMSEGPYGYTDNEIDVTVKPHDVVIDAGAWIGDFSAYAAAKGAVSYAFEPTSSTFKILEKTAALNNEKIIPVQKGLSDKGGASKISIVEGMNSAGNSTVIKCSDKTEDISITTLDDFVKENKLDRIDFIKADIEGAERNLLKGAYNLLKTFAPKLAICTYHFPEDAELLEKIIMDANPNYKVKHLMHKLFAQVM